jgi:hypothetical protein
VPNTPLCCHSDRRNIRHKVEDLNPALRKLGTEEGEKGVVVGICVFRLLPDRPTFESTLTYEQEDR